MRSNEKANFLTTNFSYQGTDWLAELASEWEQEAKNCGEAVRVVILRYTILITFRFLNSTLLSNF